MKTELSQQEIDAVFQGSSDSLHDQESKAQSFDFGRLNGIPKSQLRAVHLVHENFARSLASSLSAYLRSYVIVNLVSLEHVSYSEFLGTLALPTCLGYIELKPYESAAVLDLNLEMMFALLELLLGGKVESAVALRREITDIEKSLVQTLLRVVLTDLTEAWKDVAEVSFHLQSLASEPHLLHVIAPGEAVVVIAIEIKVEGRSGLMNLAIPSIFIKRLRTNFELLQQVRKAEPKEVDQLHIARLLQPASTTFEVRIDANRISARDLSNLKPGDVLVLDHPEPKPVLGSLNGRDLWLGQMGTAGDKLAVQLSDLCRRDKLADPAQ